jgi:hypothetical protein
VTGTSVATQADAIATAGATDLDSIAVLRMHAVQATDAAVAALRADARVASVELDRSRAAEAAPDDPSYAGQWSLPRIGWDQAFGSVAPAGSAIVAVLDTGVDASHSDIDDSLVAGASFVAGSAWNSDPNGHGTAMAGIVAAETGNGSGIAGVGYAGVRVMPVTVLGPDGLGRDSDIIEGLVWAADHGADVALLAFSAAGYSSALQAAVDYAWSKGVVVVAAVGNDGSSAAAFPAGDRGVVGVSNTDQSDTLAPSSNYGSDVFLAAPGTGILTLAPGGGTNSVTGTSASAAEVAGAAALLRAVDPSLSAGAVVGRLARSADAAGTVDETGNGRLNLARALADSGTDEVKPAGVAPFGDGGPFVGPYVVTAINLNSVSSESDTEGNAGTKALTFDVHLSGSGAVPTLFWRTVDGTATGGATCGAGVDYVSVSQTVGQTKNADFQIQVTICGDTTLESSEAFSLQVADNSGFSGSGGNRLEIGTGTIQNDDVANSAPTDIALSNSSVAENAGANATVGTLSTTDPDAGNTFTYTLVSGTGSTGNGSFNISGSTLRATASLDFEAQSSYSVRVRTTDQGGLFFEEVFTISVTNVNEAPSATVLISPASPKTNDLLTANTTTSDPDGDTVTLSYVWKVNGSTILGANTDTFSLAVAGHGDKGDLVTVEVTPHDGTVNGAMTSHSVTVANTAPTATPQSVATNEDTSKTITLSGSDLDADALTARVTGLPGNGNLYDGPTTGGHLITPAEAASGYVVTDLSSRVTYLPDLNYNNTSLTKDAFTFRTFDGVLLSTNATVEIQVDPVNDAPVCADPQAGSTNEDTALNASVVCTDVDSASLTYSKVAGPSHGTSTVNADGSFTYNPAPNYNGPDAFTFKANDGFLDGNTATYDVTVNPVNDAPVLDPIGNQSVDEDTLLTFTASATDVDGTDSLTFSLVGAPAGASIDPSTGVVAWTPTESQGPGSYTFDVVVTDDGTPNLADAETITVTVAEVNVAPVLGAIGNQSVDEGSTLSFTAAASDHDVPANTLTFSLVGAPVGATIDPSSGAFSWTPTDDGSATFTVRVTDNGTPSLHDEEQITVTVTNVAPTAFLSNNGPVDEGSPATVTFTTPFDPSSADTSAGFRYSFACTGGSAALATTYVGATNTSGTTTCAYADNGSYTVWGRIFDKDDGSTTYSTVVTVSNVAPTVAFDSGSTEVNEGDAATTYTYHWTDPGTDTWTQATSCGATGVKSNEAFDTTLKTGSFDCAWADDNPTGTASDTETVSIQVSDDDSGSATTTRTVTVSNVAPVITSLVAPLSPSPKGASISFTATFTDVGSLDTHTCLWTWDDGSTSSFTAAGTGNGTCSTTHAYTAAGVYTVHLKVTDDDTGAVEQDVPTLVVVYDPAAGFVTGGGWITTVAGSYPASPTLSGRANFGFVAKYKKGAAVPDGQTEFQFQVGNLNFHSELYQSLVVSGCKAQYRGTGTINGSGSYSFVLTAYDSAINGCGTTDRFRIKITDGGTTVYDNRIGTSDDMDLADPQGIDSGSIVIHK